MGAFIIIEVPPHKPTQGKHSNWRSQRSIDEEKEGRKKPVHHFYCHKFGLPIQHFVLNVSTDFLKMYYISRVYSMFIKELNNMLCLKCGKTAVVLKNVSSWHEMISHSKHFVMESRTQWHSYSPILDFSLAPNHYHVTAWFMQEFFTKSKLLPQTHNKAKFNIFICTMFHQEV